MRGFVKEMQVALIMVAMMICFAIYALGSITKGMHEMTQTTESLFSMYDVETYLNEMETEIELMANNSEFETLNSEFE